MADQAVVHIGENSPEEVAYKLFREIARSEKMNVMGLGASATNAASRDWILDTYAECIATVRLGAHRK